MRNEAREKTKKVLVIDDNVDSAQSLAEVLRILGYDVAVAFDGETGIASAKQLQVDLVISDIAMPGIDGYGVATALRNDENMRNVFRVAMTGFADRHTKVKAFEAGFHEHLTKPVEMGKLLTVLSAKELH